MNAIFQWPRRKAEHKILDGKISLFTRGSVEEPIWNFKFERPDGKVERKSAKTTDLQEAKRIAEARYRDVVWRASRGLSVTNTTVGMAAASYAEHLKRLQVRQGETVSRKHNIARLEKYIIPALGTLDITLLSNKRVSDFLDQYERDYHANKDKLHAFTYTKGWRGEQLKQPKVVMIKGTQRKPPSEQSRRMFEMLFRLVCEHAVKQGMITAAEQPVIAIAKAPKFRRGWFDAQEQHTLLRRLEERVGEALDDYHAAQRRLLWLFSWFHLLTGLRPGEESVDLCFQDVTRGTSNQLPHWVVHVRKGKRGARKVLVGDELGDVMRQLRRWHPDPKPSACLWTHPDGSTPKRFTHAFGLVLDELGMRRDAEGYTRSLYSLRHSKISNEILRGTNIVALAKNMGTSVTKINSTYDHIIHLTQVHVLLGHIQGTI